MREPVQLLARAGQADQVEHLGRRGGAAARLSLRGAAGRLGDLVTDGLVGLSEDIGSWNTTPILAPRTSLISRSRRRASSRPPNADAPADDRVPRAAAGGDIAVIDLARAGLAHDADDLALVHPERHPVDGVHLARRPVTTLSTSASMSGTSAAPPRLVCSPAPRVQAECIPQPVPDQVERHHGQDDRDPGG